MINSITIIIIMIHVQVISEGNNFVAQSAVNERHVN